MCKTIRQSVPMYAKVTISRVDPSKMEGLTGACSKKGKGFLIEVANNLTETETEAILIHEYAHALAWSETRPDTTDHDEIFWIWNGRVYRKYHNTL